MAIVKPPYTYSTNDVQVENWVYNFNVGSLSRSNTATTDTDITTTINSYNGSRANFTVYIVTTISRSGTDPGAFTYTSAPSLKITAGGVDATFYTTSGSVSVGGTTSGQIIFSTTFDYTLPASFANKEWTITHFEQLTETNTARVDTGTATSTGFTIPVSSGGLFFGTNF